MLRVWARRRRIAVAWRVLDYALPMESPMKEPFDPVQG